MKETGPERIQEDPGPPTPREVAKRIELIHIALTKSTLLVEIKSAQQKIEELLRTFGIISAWLLTQSGDTHEDVAHGYRMIMPGSTLLDIAASANAAKNAARDLTEIFMDLHELQVYSPAHVRTKLERIERLLCLVPADIEKIIERTTDE